MQTHSQTQTSLFCLDVNTHARQGRADDNMKRREFLSVLRFRDCASKEGNEPPSTTAASNLKLGAVDEGRDRRADLMLLVPSGAVFSRLGSTQPESGAEREREARKTLV